MFKVYHKKSPPPLCKIKAIEFVIEMVNRPIQWTQLVKCLTKAKCTICDALQIFILLSFPNK